MIEIVVRRLGGLLAYITLGVMLYGIWRGTQREPGRTSGRTGAWLRSPLFYLITSAIFLGVCFLGWKPLRMDPSAGARVWMLVCGTLLYFPGLCLVLWARLTLGRNYFASTGMGVQLFANHQLVTGGPYAMLRHPLYAGIILAAFGSLLLYCTWTTLFLACFSPLVSLRARREETALAEEFGEQWRTYCQRVPMWIPRFFGRNNA